MMYYDWTTCLMSDCFRRDSQCSLQPDRLHWLLDCFHWHLTGDWRDVDCFRLRDVGYCFLPE